MIKYLRKIFRKEQSKSTVVVSNCNTTSTIKTDKVAYRISTTTTSNVRLYLSKQGVWVKDKNKSLLRDNPCFNDINTRFIYEIEEVVLK